MANGRMVEELIDGAEVELQDEMEKEVFEAVKRVRKELDIAERIVKDLKQELGRMADLTIEEAYDRLENNTLMSKSPWGRASDGMGSLCVRTR